MNPTVYWSQNVEQVFLRIDVKDPQVNFTFVNFNYQYTYLSIISFFFLFVQGCEIQFNNSSMTFDACVSTENGPINYNFTLNLHDSTTPEVHLLINNSIFTVKITMYLLFYLQENVYEMIDHKLQFWLTKKSPGIWPKVEKSEVNSSWLIQDADKSGQKNGRKSKKKTEPVNNETTTDKGYKAASEKLHREVLEKRDVHEDYPHMYDELHKEELGYRKGFYFYIYLNNLYLFITHKSPLFILIFYFFVFQKI